MIPVTFEASQESASATSLIGMGVSGSSRRSVCACIGARPSSAAIEKKRLR